MSAAQWAPWVSVFLGGCLSGAALLSLSGERAADSKQSVTVAPPPSAPSEPSDPDEAAEVVDEDDGASDADSTASHANDGDSAQSPETEHGPSAADVLAALEQAYQRQVAESAALEAPPEPVLAEAAPPAEVEAEAVAPEVDLAAPTAAPDERVSEAAQDSEPAAADAPVEPEPVQAATVARVDREHETVQQIAVVYQPVYVLPPTADPNGQPNTSPQRRWVGRDPWAPLSISPRHNPWATTAASGGAWATIGVAGGVWAAGFTPSP